MTPNGADGALDDGQLAELRAVAQTAVDAYEKSLAATVIHYINQTLADYDAAEVDLETLAKHWSEMKGYSLCFQFSPNGPLGPDHADSFVELQALLGLAPALGDGEEDYAADLELARSLLREAYGFSAEDTENW